MDAWELRSLPSWASCDSCERSIPPGNRHWWDSYEELGACSERCAREIDRRIIAVEEDELRAVSRDIDAGILRDCRR